MRLNKQNGFDMDYMTRLDEESVKALYPEYEFNWGYRNSNTYNEWKSEHEKSGITQKQFLSEKGWTQGMFRSKVASEVSFFHGKQEQELQERFDSFVAENKEEIYKAQCDAIKDSNAKYKKQKEEIQIEARKGYEERVRQYLDGNDLAVSTLQKDDNVDFLNKLLRIGYKVRCSSASIVFLYFDGAKKPTVEQMEKIIPFEQEDKSYKKPRFYPAIYITARIKGVSIPFHYHLSGYEYPKCVAEPEAF